MRWIKNFFPHGIYVENWGNRVTIANKARIYRIFQVTSIR